jgi:dTDP-4-amino-4,6-dideoxygalactose transaminase
MRMRRQPPVYSPITLAGIGQALAHGLGVAADGRDTLRTLLQREYAADRVVLLGSGTEALQLALQLAMTKVADRRVALPAFSCFDVASAAVAAGSRLRFYDVDPNTLQPDLESLDGALAGGARVVVIAPLYGLPLDWDTIASRLARHGAVGVEDAAQGHQAAWRGRPVGSFGELSVLSFGRGKGWTGGAGGALLLRGSWPEAVASLELRRGPSLAHEAAVLLRLSAQWTFARPASYGLPAAIPGLGLGETRYRDAPPPRAMTRAASACAAAVHAKAAEEGAIRRANARAILDALRDDAPVRVVRPHPDGVPGFLRLPLRLPRGLAGFDSAAQALRRGISPSYPSVLAVLPPVCAVTDGGGYRCPGGEELARTLYTVPTHSLLTEVERREVIALLQAYRA